MKNFPQVNVRRGHSFLCVFFLAFALIIAGCSSKKEIATEALGKRGVAITADSLVAASSKGDLETIKLLIEAGVDANAADSKGNLALVDAAWSGNKDVAVYLMDSKVEIDKPNSSKITALHAAISGPNKTQAQEQLVTILLERKANSNLADSNGSSPLISAAWLGNVNAVKALVKNGAQVNYTRPSDGMTAYKAALAANHPEVAEVLKSAGATE